MRIKTKGLVTVGLVLRFAFFLVIGLALLGLGGLTLSAQFGEDYEKTTAVIEEINPVGEGEVQVIVAYTIDGVDYHTELGYYSSGMMIGDEITIKYCPNASSDIRATSVDLIGYVLVAVGGVLIYIGSRSFSKGLKRRKKDREQENSFSEMNRDVPKSARIFPDNEDGTLYYFHYDKSFSKQGHVMENKDRQVVYEGAIKQFKLIGDFEMDFINHISCHTQTHFIGHAVSTGTSHVTISEGFDYDGQNIWEYLHGRGIRVDPILDRRLMSVTFEVTLCGMPFARFVSSGTNLYGEEKAGLAKVANLSAPGLFRIYSFGDDLDLLFLIGVAIARSST